MLRRRLIDSVQRLIGTVPEVDEAVIVEQRTSLWPDVVTLAVTVVVLGLFTDLAPVFIIVAGPLVAITGLVLRRRYFIVAGAGDLLVICRSTKLNPSAAEVTVSLPRTTPIRWVESTIVDIIEIDGRRYGMSKAFRARLDAISQRQPA
ncbi:MAG: hypothetical protein ACR2QE_13520 [Acidimicrobiales bacterium]